MHRPRQATLQIGTCPYANLKTPIYHAGSQWRQESGTRFVQENNSRTNRLRWHKPKLRGHLTNKTKIHAVASVRKASWLRECADKLKRSQV